MVWVCVAVAIILTLWRCSQAALQGRVARNQFHFVLLLGIVALNPRVMQYDAGAVTLPMAVLLMRVCRAWAVSRRWAALALAGGLWGVVNLLVALTGSWYEVESILLLGVFGASAAMLLGEARHARHGQRQHGRNFTLTA